MNLNLWTICNQSIAPESLTDMFPNAVCHDSTNLVFVASDPDFPTLDLNQETGNLLPMAASALVHNQAITLTKEQAEGLFTTPHHRLWCGRYEDMDTLQADYVVVFGSELDETDIEVANGLVRASIMAMFSNSSDTDSQD